MGTVTRTPRREQGSAPQSTPKRAPKPSFPVLIALLPCAITVWLIASLASASTWAAGMLRRLGVAEHDAQDIRQDAVTAALFHWDRFNPSPEEDLEIAVRKWFCGIALNYWRMMLRFRRAHPEVPLPQDPPPEELRDPGHEGRIEARDMLQALEKATSEERWRAWFAFEAEGWTVAEIAEHEGVARTVINARIRGAREDFATVLGHVGGSRRSRGGR